MMQFDIISYISSLTSFTFDRAVLQRIAYERGVSEVTCYDELTQKDRDLLLADLLFMAYTMPYQTSSLTKQHGAYSQTIGSQIISDKRGIYDLMMSLYKKWNDDKAEVAAQMGGGLRWLTMSEDDY